MTGIKDLKTLISSYQSNFPVEIFFDDVSTLNQDDLNKNLHIAKKSEFTYLLNNSIFNDLEHFEINTTKNNKDSKWINLLSSKLKYLFMIFLLNLLPLSYLTYKNQKDYNTIVYDLNLILNKNIAATQLNDIGINIKDKIDNFISIQKKKKLSVFIANFNTILSKLVKDDTNYEIEYIELAKQYINVNMKITNYNLLKLNELIKEQFLKFETIEIDSSLFQIKIFIDD